MIVLVGWYISKPKEWSINVGQVFTPCWATCRSVTFLSMFVIGRIHFKPPSGLKGPSVFLECEDRIPVYKCSELTITRAAL